MAGAPWEGPIEGSPGLADDVTGLGLAVSAAPDAGDGEGVALAQPTTTIALRNIAAPSLRMRISFERHGDVRTPSMLRPRVHRALVETRGLQGPTTTSRMTAKASRQSWVGIGWPSISVRVQLRGGRMIEDASDLDEPGLAP